MEIILAIILLFLLFNFINEILKFLFYILLYIFYPVLWIINKIINLFKQIYSQKKIKYKINNSLTKNYNRKIKNNEIENKSGKSSKIFLCYFLGFFFLIVGCIIINTKNYLAFTLIILGSLLIIKGSKLRDINSSNNTGNSNQISNNNITSSIKIKDNSDYYKSYQEKKYNFDEIREARNKFNKCLYIANQQKTKELLEVLIEFDDLDEAYLKVKKLDANFMSRNAFEETKLNILDDIINDKFRKCSGNKKKKTEYMKSLLDELYVCKRRYPEYKEILEKHITIINNIINNN